MSGRETTRSRRVDLRTPKQREQHEQTFPGEPNLFNRPRACPGSHPRKDRSYYHDSGSRTRRHRSRNHRGALDLERGAQSSITAPAHSGRLRQLGVRLQGSGLLRAAERSNRRRRARRRDRALNFIHRDASGGEQVGINLDSYGIFLRAEDRDLRHAGQGGKPLADVDFGKFVDGRKRKALGDERQLQHRRSAWIYLSIGRRGRHLGRELACGIPDRGLNILSRGIDASIEVELHRDAADAEPANRCDRVDARNGGKFSFKRR